MGQFIDLTTALSALTSKIDEAEALVADATRWVSAPPAGGGTTFSRRHKEIVTETAFLRAFLAWEEFLEEAFVLYLLGHNAPKGTPPVRYASPTNIDIAHNLIIPEDRHYVTWTASSKLGQRAERFFQGGLPFKPALSSFTSAFDEMKTIRNALAHWDTPAQNRFFKIARNKLPLGTLPRNFTIGAFLSTKIPGSSPPETFFDDYINRIRIAADNIVPT